MALNGRKLRSRPRGEVIAALDVGTSKVVCFIARIADDGAPQVVGIGHQLSHGVRGGTVVDMEAAEKAIGHAVSAAERLAGESVRDVVVNLSGGYPSSQTVGVEVAIGGHEIADADLRRAVRSQHQLSLPGDSQIVHAIPIGYAIDGNRGIRDPRGMFGQRLGIDLHVVLAGEGSLRNLATCIGRCHLETETFVLSAYAAGLACLVPDEADLGCTVIDMGGGTTSMAVFVEGQMVFADCIPVGGAHVTNDIARGLTTPVAHAERMKTLYGNAIPSAADEREIIDVPQVGEEEPAQANHVPKSLLTGIIQPRMEEIFELARGRLEASGVAKSAGRRVVLTGGASQLQGVRDLAQQVLDKQVRMGRPYGVAGLAEATAGPAFATAAGLLLYATRRQSEATLLGALTEEPAATVWSRLGTWFREYL